jgi:hypothetical protein
MAIEYPYNSVVRADVAFTAVSGGTAVDPGTVTAKVRDPSRNVSSFVYNTDDEVVKSATGNYYIDIELDEAGLWKVRWDGEGANQAAGETEFFCKYDTVSS